MNIKSIFLKMFSLVFAVLIFLAYKGNTPFYKLKGIFVKTPIAEPGKCTIFNSDSIISEFNLYNNSSNPDKKAENLSYNELRWLHDKDYLIADESVSHGNGRTEKTNIVKLDIKGNLVERIITSKKGDYISWIYPSKKGTRIVYVTDRHPRKPGSSTEHMTKSTLYILNLNARLQEDSIPDFNNNQIAYWGQSPWSPDERRFVYTQRKELNDPVTGKYISPIDTNKTGSYIYDLNKSKNIKFIKGSIPADWHPDSNFISFVKKDNSVWLYDVSNETYRLFYKPDSKITGIKDMHWSPDGLYLLLQCYSKKTYHAQKLIDFKTGLEIPCKDMNLYDYDFSWK